MAGHVQDRWWKATKRPDGRQVREKTALYGTGDRYKVRYYDPDGNEKSKTFPDRTLRQANAFLTKMQNDVLSGTYVDIGAGQVKFREYAESVRKGRSRDESTVETMTLRLEKQVYPFLGSRRLVSFNAELIREWLGWMNDQDKPISDSYQKQLFNLVSSILDAAVADKKIRANPCRDSSISRPKPGERKVRPWPETRLRKVELALPPRHKIVVPLGAGLGLRQGEIFAFTLDDVDRHDRVYHCNRQMVTVGGVRKFKLPKGHKTRSVPLGDGVLEALDAYAENWPAVTITLPWAERDGKKTETVNVLMVNGHGTLYRRQAFNEVVWKPAFVRAGLKYIDDEDGMHAMRHLFASAMLAQGVSIKEVAAYLGHSSEAFTLKTYVHLMPSSHERARLAVNAMFKPRKPAKSTQDSPEASGE